MIVAIILAKLTGWISEGINVDLAHDYRKVMTEKKHKLYPSNRISQMLTFWMISVTFVVIYFFLLVYLLLQVDAVRKNKKAADQKKTADDEEYVTQRLKAIDTEGS